MENSGIVVKAAAYVLKENAEGAYQLLISSIPSKPQMESRVPGGNVDADEEIETALFRELEEESGLNTCNRRIHTRVI